MVENLQYVFELKDHGSDHVTKILNFARQAKIKST